MNWRPNLTPGAIWKPPKTSILPVSPESTLLEVSISSQYCLIYLVHILIFSFFFSHHVLLLIRLTNKYCILYEFVFYSERFLPFTDLLPHFQIVGVASPWWCGPSLKVAKLPVKLTLTWWDPPAWPALVELCTSPNPRGLGVCKKTEAGEWIKGRQLAKTQSTRDIPLKVGLFMEAEDFPF